MKYVDERKFDGAYIKKKLMPDAVWSSIIYSIMMIAFVVLTVMMIDIIITGIGSRAIVGTVASIICLLLFLYLIKLYSIPTIDHFRRIICLRNGDYNVVDSVVEEMEVTEGRFYSMGPTIRASSFVFKSDDGQTWTLPQGRFKRPLVYSGQHAWLINYGKNKSFSMDYVINPESMK